MVFAWQGLQFEHPSDWSPLSLSGDRKQGYARICSPDTAFLQVRWQRGSGTVTEATVESYLAKLAGDAKRRKASFSSQIKANNGKIQYSYKSDLSGKGVLFPFESQNDSAKGLVFLEAVNSSNSVFKGADSTFLIQRDPLERWSLHSLDIRVPYGLNVDAHELKAGKTVIQLSGVKMKVVAERWGFAEMLLARQSLDSWTRSLSRLPNACVLEDESGTDRVAFFQKRPVLPDVWVRAKVSEELNQIDLIRVEARNPDLQPQWNWFAH